MTDVSRSFGGVHAVEHASFVVTTESVTGLIGPNGAGKSTMCNLIAGSLAPDEGSVRYAGQEVAGRHAHELARLGLLRDVSDLERIRTADRDREPAGGGRRQARREPFGVRCSGVGTGGWERANLDRARLLLQEFDLLHIADQRAGELSGGQKRLVEIMRAIIAAPKSALAR